jgi:hypothetical protein
MAQHPAIPTYSRGVVAVVASQMLISTPVLRININMNTGTTCIYIAKSQVTRAIGPLRPHTHRV